jgi:hypothetical protein
MKNYHSFVHSSYLPHMSLLIWLPESSGGRVKIYPSRHHHHHHGNPCSHITREIKSTVETLPDRCVRASRITGQYHNSLYEFFVVMWSKVIQIFHKWGTWVNKFCARGPDCQGRLLNTALNIRRLQYMRLSCEEFKDEMGKLKLLQPASDTEARLRRILCTTIISVVNHGPTYIYSIRLIRTLIINFTERELIQFRATGTRWN